MQLTQATIIEFDRGGMAGKARYNLVDGTYKFSPSSGAWELFRDSPTTTAAPSQLATAAANPIPAN
jgi:hypothetical protein